MSDSPDFSSTITGGIQNISAVLPLLGSKQCEENVGSALDGDVLYAAVTPLSIFGSLGIVRASLKILVCSLNIPRYQFLGAKLLHHGGFSLSGSVAPMIALDPEHPDQFLAETKLEEMLAEEHIDNVPGLTVSWAEGTAKWNFKLVVSTLVMSSAGLLPYISLVLNSDNTSPNLFFPIGLGFPLLRVFGSAGCVIIAQFLIQLRTLIIMKTRLLFISIDRLAKADKVEDLSSQINAGLEIENADRVPLWTPELAAERSMWALQKWLSTMPNMEGGESCRQVEAFYTSGYTQHFRSINTHIPSWIPVILCIGLAIGSIFTVIGYIGCFFLVQESTSTNGPLLWLVLEAALSAIHISIWKFHTPWDDSKGLEFTLQLSPSPSLFACNRTLDDLLNPLCPRALAMTAQSDVTIEQVVAYAGPRPTFSVEDVEIFYIAAIKNRTSPSKTLLMVVSTNKQQQNRLLVKETIHNPFSIYNCSLSALGSSEFIAIEVFERRERNSDAPLSDSVFMAELEAHYDTINLHLRNQQTTAERKATFEETWSWQQPLTNTAYNSQPPIHAQIGTPLLTEGEKAYLDYYAAHEHWNGLNESIDRWATNQVGVYIRVLSQVVLPPTYQGATESRVVLFLKQQEAIEKAHLIMECQKLVERFLICTYAEWLNNLRATHANMVELNLKPFLETTGESFPGTSSTGGRHWINIHKYKLEAKFLKERDYLFRDYALSRMNTAINRLQQTQRVFHAARVANADESQTAHELDNLRDELVRYYVNSLPNLHANLAEVFQLPPNIAATFNNAVSASEKYGVLLQHQRAVCVEKMEHRLSDCPPSSHNKEKAMIDHVRARCRMRMNHLFDIFMSSVVINVKHIIDLPNLHTSLELENILSKAEHEWVEMVEKLVRMGTGSTGKHFVQTKITQHFVKHGVPRQPTLESNFESAAISSENNPASHISL